MSEELESKVLQAFRKLDVDSSGEVDLAEALKMFTRFSGLAAKKLVEDMDGNGDKVISLDEWHLYFCKVLCCGDYSEKDVLDEIDVFLEMGEAFCFQLPGAGKSIKTVN